MSEPRPAAVAPRRWPAWLGSALALALASVAATPSGNALQSRLGPLYQRLDGRQVSPHLWLAMAEDPFPEVRRLAVHVLASVADPAHLPLLERYQRDPSPLVRAEVMVAAGRLGVPGVGLAREGVRDATPVVRQAAAWALAHGGASGCVTLLARLPLERDPAVLETMLGSLFRCGEQDWASAAARAVEADSPGLRRAAAATLARGAGHVALDRLVQDPEPVIRATALAGLIHGPFATSRAALVVAALDDADWRVRTAACTVLAARAEAAVTAETGDRLVALAQSPQLHLRIAALRALGAHPEAGSTATLLILTGSESPWIAAEALDAAARREPAKALPILTAWLAGTATWQRRAAAAAVTRLPPASRGAVEKLVMADRDAGVRLAWLERLEAAPDGRVEWLRDRLRTDPDPAVRSAILDLLAAAGQAGDRGQLLDRVRSWRNDSLGDARASALLAALAVSVDDRSRREVVDLALADPDDGVGARLVAAARELGLTARLPAREPRHGAAWYRELADWASEPRWLDVATEAGSFRIRLDTAAAPITSREVFDLARSGFYDGLTMHRVVPNFVVQGGDPRGDGWGGPGFTLPDEPSMVPFDSWRVGIATSGPHTGGCQLFVTLLPADRLTGHYTNLGEVVEGREALTRFGVGDRILKVTPHTGEPGPLGACRGNRR